MDGAHTRTLQRALEAIGSKEGLATVLQTLKRRKFAELRVEGKIGADMRRYKEPVSRPQPSARYSCAALATPCSRSACGKKSV